MWVSFAQAAAEHRPPAGGNEKQKGGDDGERRPAQRPTTCCRRWRPAHRFDRGGRWRRGLGLGRLADLQRINVHRLRDVLELRCAEIADLEVEPPFNLPVGLL